MFTKPSDKGIVYVAAWLDFYERVCVSPCMEPAKNVSLGHENVTCTYHGHSQGRREGRSTDRMLCGRLEFLNVLPFQNKIKKRYICITS